MALQRTIRQLHDAYVKGTEDQEFNEFMTEAEWMFRTGLTTADWDELSHTDVEMLVLHNALQRHKFIEIISYGVAKGIGLAFSKKKEGVN